MQRFIRSGIALDFINTLGHLRRNFVLRALLLAVILALVLFEAAFLLACGFTALEFAAAPKIVWQVFLIITIILSLSLLAYYLFQARSGVSFIVYLFKRSPGERDAALAAFEFANRITVSRNLDVNTETGELALSHINAVWNLDYQPFFLPTNKNLIKLMRLFAILFFVPALFYIFLPNRLYPIATYAVAPVIGFFSPKTAMETERTFLTDISITYTPPSYTGKKPYTVRGSDGSILAPRGSRIEISAALKDSFKSAVVILPGGAEVPAEINGERFSAGFQIMEEGRYYAEFKKTFGSFKERSRPINFIPDEPPRVSMFGPEGFPQGAVEFVVRGSEKLILSFRAEDDFGLTDVKFVYGRAGEKKSEIEVASAINKERYSNSYIWDISKLGALSGERIPFYFTAADNDTISGPKAGSSQVKYLKIFSLSEYESAQERAARALWEKAVESLAGYLSFGFLPLKFAEISQAIKNLEQNTEELHTAIIKFLTSDPLENISGEIENVEGVAEKVRLAFSQFERDLSRERQVLRASFSAARISAARGESAENLKSLTTSSIEEHIKTLEKHILYIEDLLDKLRMENIMKRLDELENRYKTMKNRLEELAKSGDQRLMEELLAEINRLFGEMQKLAEELAALQKVHDDEFVNMKALLDKKEGDLKKLSELVKAGKLDEAMRELELVGEMMADLKKRLSGRMMNIDSQYIEFMRDFSAAYAELEKTIKEEEEIIKETRHLDEKLRKMDDPKARKEMDDLIKRIMELAKKVNDNISAMKIDEKVFHGTNLSQESLIRFAGTMLKLLEERDFYSASEVVESLKSQIETAYFYHYRQGGVGVDKKFLAKLTSARYDVSELKQLLEKLLKAPERNIGDSERELFKKLAERQQKTGQDTRRLAEKFEKLRKEAPMLGDEMPRAIKEGSQYMEGARGKLSQNSSGKALAEEERAVGKLKGVKETLEKMAQGGGDEGGFPMPIGGGGMPRGRGNLAGSQGFRERVKIPSPEEFKAPKEYRSELMKGMKLPAPEGYKPQVKQYFEELAR
ncbi:MAG: hypothetical protein Kow0090_15430 [Myxococcota bacterium]